MIIVGAVVGNVQFAVAIDECQVSIAVQATGMTCADSDEVTVIYIVDRRSGIAIYRCGIGKE